MPTLKPPSPATIAAQLTVPERMMLFCAASNTDSIRAGVKAVTARELLVKGLIERVSLSISHYRLTEQGRAVFNELVRPPVNEQDGG
jgi:hypothetical protein